MNQIQLRENQPEINAFYNDIFLFKKYIYFSSYWIAYLFTECFFLTLSFVALSQMLSCSYVFPEKQWDQPTKSFKR